MYARQGRFAPPISADRPEPEPVAVPGKRTLAERLPPGPNPPPIQRKAAAASAAEPGPAPGASGGGSPMAPEIRGRMERVFGADFSAVRIHHGEQAAALGALAYTQGTDIHFAPGQYDPSSPAGVELLGHELTHVVQQAHGRAQPRIQAKGVAIDDDPALEREADEMGARAARGDALPGAGAALAVRASSAGPVQRQRQQAIPSAGNFLVSDDNTMAVDANAPTKRLYAKAGKIANIKLPDSPLVFSALGDSITVPATAAQPDKQLHRVHVRNLQNDTEGDQMQITDDCGRAAETVIGHNAAHGTLNARAQVGGWDKEYAIALVRIAKLEILLDAWEQHAVINPQALPTLRGHVATMKELLAQDKRPAAEALAAKIDTIMTGHYNKVKSGELPKVPPEKLTQAEQAAGINRFADVLPGQAFVIASSNDTHPQASAHGLGTWVYHWAGVIMAGEGGDTVALEILANAGPTNWFYDMYSKGTNQSFHDKHAATLQHGTTPFTLGVKRSDEVTVTTAGAVAQASGAVVAIGDVVPVSVRVDGQAVARVAIRLGDGRALVLVGAWAGRGAVAGQRGAARGDLGSLLIDVAGNDWGAIEEVVDVDDPELNAELAALADEPDDPSSAEAAPPSSASEAHPKRSVYTLELLDDWSKFEPL